jgi:hypothetical protein
MRVADLCRGVALRVFGSIRPTVGMFLCFGIVFILVNPAESYMFGAGVIWLIGSYQAGTKTGKRIGSPRFADDATDATAVLAGVLLLLDAFASGGHGGPPIYLPAWLDHVWLQRALFLFAGFVYAALPQGYAYLIHRLKL